MQRELTEDEGRFLRIHKSFLVNMNDISTLKRYQVQLFSGKQLPIPRERYAVVEMQYEEWKNRNVAVCIFKRFQNFGLQRKYKSCNLLG